MTSQLRMKALAILAFSTLGAMAQLRLLHSQAVDIIYCDSLNVAVQASWTLRPTDIKKNVKRSSFRFTPDDRVGFVMPNNIDYLLSGYDRGHLCPAADRSSSASLMKQTFVLSNVVPQLPAFNRGPWKHYEAHTRALLPEHDSLKVVVSCLWYNADTSFIGVHRLAVPHAFVKQVFDASTMTLIETRYFNH